MMVMTLPFSEHEHFKVPPKEENDDEIEVMAKRIKFNDKKIAHLTPVVWNHGHSAFEDNHQQPENLPSDWTSVQGQFGWVEIETEVIPYIIRDGQKYIAERVLEIKLLINYRYIFHEDLFCYRVTKLSLTVAEMELLDEINKTHCDCLYGSVEFSKRDNIVLLDDVMEICKFMKFCYEVLVNKNQPTDRQCSFIRITENNSVHNVPYVLFQSKYYVPLFYFDGKSVELLGKKAIQISGWPLTYLRLTCKVQGVGCRHYEKDQLEVVELDLVKQFFYVGTAFHECWLTNVSVDHLVKNKFNPQQVNRGLAPTTNGHPTENRYLHAVISAQTSRFQNVPNVRQYNGNKGPFSSPLQAMMTQVQRCDYRNYSYQNLHFSTTSYVSQNQNKPTPPYPNNPNLSSGTRSSTVYHNSCKTLPTTRNSSQNKSLQHPTNSRLPSFRNIPQNSNRPTTNNSSPGPLRASLTNCPPRPTVILIPEQPEPLSKSHKLQTIRVDDQLMYNCINIAINDQSYLLVSLEEVVSAFSVSMDDLLMVLIVLRIEVYYPNNKMAKLLSSAGINRTKGLIQSDALIEYLQQIKYMLRLSRST